MKLPSIAFFDTEIDAQRRKTQDIGCLFDDGREFHDTSPEKFTHFLRGADFVCGHNILQHDLKYVRQAVLAAGVLPENSIDTLHWSPLLFPQKPYHALLKDDKLQTEEANNPLNDAKKARDLFHDETAAFLRLEPVLKNIFYQLLHDKPAFSAFFKYLNFQPDNTPAEPLIFQKFRPDICERADLPGLVAEHPIELAYSLALINSQHRYSIMPPWVLKNYPEVERVMAALRNRPCLEGCLYCNQNLDIFKGLKNFFGFDGYRKYAGEPLQEKAVRAAIENRSLLAVFPTGGGKSITFQVPALMQGHSMKGLTVVISPLQSLMKDQVDNLEKAGITEAVTINGLLDPIERAKSFERVEDGSASMLYISPESLRSKSIERLLLNRKIARFVIDEATDEEAEARIDYISDHLGIEKEGIFQIINLLRTEKILGDAKDLTAFIKRGEHKNRSLAIAETFRGIENFLLNQIDETEKTYSLKALNEAAEAEGCRDVSPRRIKTVLNFWAIKNWVKRHQKDFSSQFLVVKAAEPLEKLKEKLEKRHELARSAVEFLYEKSRVAKTESEQSDEVLVEFSVQELIENFERQPGLFQKKTTPAEVEDALFYLSRIEALKIEGGFMVVYNRLSIVRLEENNKVQYKNEDYQKLNQFYENRVQQIHIVGEYAKKMVNDYVGALRFVDDYFQLNYSSFLGKYFPGSRGAEIKRNITPAKYRELFQSLSEAQRQIIDDKNSPHIVVAAGPGSGKTKVLVHKLAALLLMEDVKHEQLLMLTFSRAAATEFKKRLTELIGSSAHFVEIKTFHSYCFDLLGKVGSLEKSGAILKNTVEKIRNNEIEMNRITKSVLVIDEAQDMNADEFELVKVLIEKNEGLRVIAVGDDDQNIYEFRGSDSKYLTQFIEENNALKYELTTNFRSRSNLVAFANAFVKSISKRLKTNEIRAHNPAPGSLKLVRYESRNLIEPLVKDLLATNLTGTACVLTKTNEEAAQIVGLLVHHGRQAKLIQTNDGFPLQNLLEIRFFINALQTGEPSVMISEEVWEKAKRAVFEKFKSSPKFEIVLNLVKDFQETNPKRKYWSDFQAFVRESKIEDFYRQDGDVIFVSTIHKAKGKEFDHVFLLLDGFNANSDEAKRQVYVALTRAKNNLCIHTNGRFFDPIEVPNLQRIENAETWQPPHQIAVQLNLKDVYLGYFTYVQHRVENLSSGQNLQIQDEGLADGQGKLVVKFSKIFQEKVAARRESGYILTEARVNFIVFWENQEDGKEYKVVLPELVFGEILVA